MITRLDHVVIGVRDLDAAIQAWRRPWPFLIQWDTPDEQRLAWEGVGQHSNGALGVAGLRVAARDVAGVLAIYDNQLGLAVSSSTVALPNCPIEIIQAENDDEGLVEVQLRVGNLADTRAGLPLGERSLGARLVFVE